MNGSAVFVWLCTPVGLCDIAVPAVPEPVGR